MPSPTVQDLSCVVDNSPRTGWRPCSNCTSPGFHVYFHRMKTYIRSALQKLEKLEEHDHNTHQLIEAVQSTIITCILAARTLHVHLDTNVVDILNTSVNRADTEFSQDVMRLRRMECWRRRVVACAEEYNRLTTQPLRQTMEHKLAQELRDMIKKEVESN
jgi:hypothetical protein